MPFLPPPPSFSRLSSKCYDSYGGKVVFFLKMGPSAQDPATAVCKPAYGGNVYLYYSVDQGETWEILSILETFVYRKEEFTQVCVQLLYCMS